MSNNPFSKVIHVIDDVNLYEKYKGAVKDNKLPLAFVDLDLLDKNIDDILKRTNGKKIRIATKSIRSIDIIKYIINKSPESFSGLMSFYANEANWLAENGLDNILIAYPYIRENHISKTIDYIKAGKNITFMIDNVIQAEELNKIAANADIQFNICIDIDMSVDFSVVHFGVFRSHINSVESMQNLLEGLKSFDNLKLNSLMGYEAQIAGVGDNNGFNKLLNIPIRILKKLSIPKIHRRREQLVNLCLEYGHKLDFINGGGTGSIESTIADQSVTEVAVGSGFFSPGLFDNYIGFQHQPAAAYAVEITRNPTANIYTCAGGGYVASGQLGMDKIPKPYLPIGINLLKNEMAGEVQTPVKYTGKDKIKLGDPVFFRHSKAGELCERFKELKLIRNGSIVDTANTYRGDGKCFL
jgi:D-serine deaminase-like pyridoxal phosphate-dependent protein